MHRYTLTKAEWIKIYRLARQPDLYLADPVILSFPVRYLFIANECLRNRNGTYPIYV